MSVRDALSLLAQGGNYSLQSDPLLCLIKLVKLYNGLKTGDQESLYFVDGLGKPGSGVLNGNTLLVGDYDLCREMKQSSKGYYLPCLSNALLNYTGPGVDQTASVTWTTCLPEECHGDVFSELVNTVQPQLAHYNLSVNVTSTQCQTPTHWDLPVYLTLTLLVVFLTMSVVGTLWAPIAQLLCPVPATDDEPEDDDDDEPLINTHSEGSVPAERATAECSVTTAGGTCAAGADCSRTAAGKAAWLTSIGSVVQCFDVAQGVSALLSTDSKPGQVLCLNGIRVLSIGWVVLGHMYYLPWALGSLGDSVYGWKSLLSRSSFQYITNAVFAVDSFFLLSGFLVSYLLLKEVARRGTFKPLPYVLHRYIRLTLPYLIVILLEGWLYPAVIQGPYSSILSKGSAACKKYWWANLLYINNLVPWSFRQMCVGQSWYLANDFQFYLLAPVFILALYHRPVIGNVMLWGGVSASVAAAGVSYSFYGFNLANHGEDTYFLHQYIKPWIRAPPYLIGVFGGWVYWRYGVTSVRGPVWRRVALAAVLWCSTLTIQWAVLQGQFQDINIQHHRETKAKDVSYEMLSRCVWALALLVQILACQTGLGGWVNSVLSWRGMLPLARLTYGVYLLHIGLLTLLLTQLRHPWFVAPDYEVAVLYCGVLVVSYGAAALLYLLVQQPFTFLETFIRTRGG